MDTPEQTDTPNGRPLGPVAEYGSWAITADGQPVCVVSVQPACHPPTARTGYAYGLMYVGGHEETLYQWDGDEHLTRSAGLGRRPEEHLGMFTVVTPDQIPR